MTEPRTDPVSGFVRNDPNYHARSLDYYLAVDKPGYKIEDRGQRAIITGLASILAQLTRIADVLEASQSTGRIVGIDVDDFEIRGHGVGR